MKKIIVLVSIIGVLILIVISIDKKAPKDKLATVEHSESGGIAKEAELLSSIEWLKRYPQLKNVLANSQTAVIDKLRVSESISELIGPIDNPYGVRNDILAAILQIVPESNPRMLKAAIKTAYYDNLSYYSPSNNEKLDAVKQYALALHCVSIFDGDQEGLNGFLNVSQTIADLMRDTRGRIDYTTKVDKKVFAWKPLGTGLGGNTEEERCQNEEY